MLKRAFLFVVLFGIGLLTYYRGLHIPFYNDDFQRAFTNPREMVFQGFTSANPHDGFYRPLEQTALAAIQILWKWDSLPIRLLHLLFNSALALLVFHSLRKLEVHLVSAVIAALYVIMSQLGAFTILSNNTLSQVMGSFFSALSLWLLYQYHELGRSEGDRGKYYLSIFFFILALLSKETSTGLLPAIFFLITTGQTTNADGLRKLRRIFLEMLPYNLGLLFYGFLRMNAGGNLPVFGSSDMYGFRIGSNLLKHLWLFMGEAVLPVSTVTVIRAQYVHTYVVVLVSFIFAGILFPL
ncbi:MAG: glycosyltransferase family 39 protein [Bacteroidota bacterium]|nr:glycosyltransferase family 39 protein [Bacteroidota bacterium]